MNLATCDRTIDAPVDIVWTLLTSADGLNAWMSVASEVDLRPGGSIRWTHDNGWVVAGTIQEIVPMRRLVFTYGWETGGFPVPIDSSVVSIELTALGDLTHVSVRHDGLTEPMAQQHAQGWERFMDRLAACAAGRAALPPTSREPRR
ncbi:MAG: SRPBCC domain-containing protein [Thermoleophilia bacterium]